MEDPIPQRNVQVQEWLERLTKALAMNAEVTAQLQTRLEPVLSTGHAGDEAKIASEPEGPLCQIAEVIRSATTAVERDAHTKERILSDLEI